MPTGESVKAYSFEIMRHGAWSIERIIEDKDEALELAHTHLKRFQDARVRVTEERFNEQRGDSHSAVIFVSAQPKLDRAETFLRRRRQARHCPVAPQPPADDGKKPDFVIALLQLVLVVGGLGIAILIGLAFLTDFLA